ncbi:anthranilate phosphoribosyltransferase [Saccharopolyspora erythraea NRRL 2338]|uniref:Anthranilate phosphoribosyltransferase n=2 Tax=Saccharopolyspora erythraea TaxID=1836 RepID=TRPD_SACEN|nr:RecName: Full=Anthranilate phosphoribosyltransferase [Saccharopolyspora erythraea NRRL 2338]CAM01000.1 anthranilate phosphoribosyltransferase [Saccharopolyspora erythraea NRRL 2338]
MGTMAGSWAALLGHLVAGNDLSAEDTAWAMDLVMTGEATPARVAAFVVALRAKGETPAEVRGMADAMLSHSRPLEIRRRAVDIVGTGGDRSGSVNISTMASIVVAAAGVPVVKHGNRAASSKCGTADVLEALGVAIDLPPEGVRRCVEDLGIGFCFAPVFHPAMRHAAGPRREIGIPTAFNVLGPLTNPARPSAGLIGCGDQRMAPVMAEVFAARGGSVLLVRGDDGMDEITTTTTTTVWVVQGGTVTEESIDPAEFGIGYSTPAELQGGDAEVNAEVVRRLVAGEAGPVRDAVLLNAAGALAAFEGPGTDLRGRLGADVERVAAAIDSGAAADLLDRWAKRSTEIMRESE